MNTEFSKIILNQSAYQLPNEGGRNMGMLECYEYYARNEFPSNCNPMQGASSRNGNQYGSYYQYPGPSGMFCESSATEASICPSYVETRQEAQRSNYKNPDEGTVINHRSY